MSCFAVNGALWGGVCIIVAPPPAQHGEARHDDEAKVRYQDVLHRDPNAAIAANNLAWLMAQNDENIDLALQFAQTAKTKLPLPDADQWKDVKEKLQLLQR